MAAGGSCDGYLHAPPVSLEFDVPGSAPERRGYDFFRLKSVHHLLGDTDGIFWKSVFLQMSHTERAIKHALIAIASLHESIELSERRQALCDDQDTSRRLRGWSLSQYSKAINLFAGDPQQKHRSLEKALILCILFIGYELFQSNYQACSMHLDNGLKLLHHWRQSKNVLTRDMEVSVLDSDLVENHIAPIFTRLDVQESILIDSRAHRLPLVCENMPPYSKPFTETLQDLASARVYSDRFMQWIFFAADYEHGVLLETSKDLAEQNLEDSLELLEKALAKPHADDHICAMQVLKVYYHLSIIILHTRSGANESSFDRHIRDFKEIVKSAEEVVLFAQSHNDRTRLSFSFDFGIAPPLFFAASHCRDPFIRRRATALLRASHRIYGAFNSESSATVADFVIKIEESEPKTIISSCKDIPNNKRVRKVANYATYDFDYSKVQYKHVAPCDSIPGESIDLWVERPWKSRSAPVGYSPYLQQQIKPLPSPAQALPPKPKLKPRGGESINYVRANDPGFMASFVAKAYFPLTSF